jgi:hypothetical protein
VNPVVWGFIGTAVGAGASFSATWLQQKHAGRRELAAFMREAERAHLEKQCDALAHLQRALAKVAYCRAEVLVRRLAVDGRFLPFADPLSARTRAADIDATATTELVLNNEIRVAAVKSNDELRRASEMEDVKEARRAHESAVPDYLHLQDRIGDELRRHMMTERKLPRD